MRRNRITFVVVALIAGLLAAAAPVGAAGETGDEPSRCDAFVDGAIVGTPEGDLLEGTPGDDVIIGAGGNDTINGNGGNDLVCGGSGNDTITTGDGSDRVDGGSGSDKLTTNGGDDELTGGDGHDDLESGDGGDVIDAGAGNDKIAAGDGSDDVDAGDGNDHVDLGPGDDQAFGGEGNDHLDGGPGSDGLDGAAGNDTLLGGEGPDGLDGGEGNDTLRAGTGDDSLFGRLGNDTLDGSDGDDLCVAGNGPGDTTKNCERTSADAPDGDLRDIEPADPAEAGPRIVEAANGPFLPDLRVVIDSNGGITSQSVRIVPSRWTAFIVPAAMASGSWEITIPEEAPPINGATLTIPYDEELLPPGYDETNLRILTFDEEFQLWRLAGDNQVVDTVANTVSVEVDGFSIFAVMMVNAAGTLEDFLRPSIPIVCIPEDAGAEIGLDVVFMIDQSGSMSWNDPSGLRIDAAKAFVDEMRDEDRAGVVSFTSSAQRRSGLRLLGDPGARTAVDNAIEAARPAGGGTNISNPMLEMLDVYADAPPVEGARIRVAILLTDGVGTYDPAITAQAADADVVVYTIGLGADIDAALLQGIADGTNGRFEQLASADQLVPLYEELIGGLIDDGTDTDGDRLTDCEETNGLLSALGLYEPDGPYPLFYFSDPLLIDGDFDLVPDNFQPGNELWEVIRAQFANAPGLAEEYQYLIDLGITSYFVVRSDPLDEDSDGDSFLDNEDPKPLDPGVPGLDDVPFEVAPTTLYQRDLYGPELAILDRFVLKPQGSSYIVRTVEYRTTVQYDEDFDCVDPCFAIQEWAEQEPNDNGLVPCFFGKGRCVTDQSQIRDAIKQIVTVQGVWDGNTEFVSEDFVTEQAAGWCSILYEGCDYDEIDRDVGALDLDDIDPVTAFGVAPRTANVTATRTGLRANPRVVAAITAAIVAGIAIDRIASPQGRVEANVELGTRQCLESNLLAVVGLVGGKHPCEALDLYFPGPNLNKAHDLRFDAVRNNPLLVAQNYLPDDLRTDGLTRDWFNGEPECDADARAAAPAGFECDEFPNFRTVQAGRLAPPLAVLELIPGLDNSREGGFFGNFVKVDSPGCGLAPQERFGVIPLPKDGPRVTFHICKPTS